MTPAIQFGTDGWRALIAEDYTFDNVRAVAQATAEYLQHHGLADGEVVVGYDTRFASDDFAVAVAEVLAGNGIRVALTSDAVPTPVISFTVRDRGAVLAVMITASHNPAIWNGFKVKPAYGGSAPRELTGEIEGAIPGVLAESRVQRQAIAVAERTGLVTRIDPREGYIASVRRFVDLDAIRAAGYHVLVDSMHGASAGWLAAVVGDPAPGSGRTHITELRAERNPAFPGMRAPEPIAVNLAEQRRLLAAGGYHVGFATDGDGDRFGLLDERGNFINQLQMFALLARYFLAVRGDRGAIVRSITSTRMIDKLGERYGCPVIETPVGFTHLSPQMIAHDALLAGEESGGIGFRGHVPERDGVLSALYFLDGMVRTGRTPSELLADLYAEVGPHEYHRVDITLQGDERDAILDRVRTATPQAIAGRRVTGRDTLDGFRFTLEGGWWLLMRFSGTEPLLRVYAEMPSREQVDAALQAGLAMAGVDTATR